MRKRILLVLSALLCVSLTACFQISTLVKVKPDGSGNIEETFLMSKELVKQMNAMASQMSAVGEEGGKPDKKKGKKPAKDMFGVLNVEELKKKVNEMGEGVTYVSSNKVTTDTLEGYRAVYAFKDINKVKFNQNPGEKMSPGQGGGSTEKKEFVSFQFTKGNPSRLNINMPESKTPDKPKEPEGEVKKEQPDDQNSEMMKEQMKKMFTGMKIGFDVEVIGKIVETNATHRKGGRITIMELDFEKLLEMPEELKKFSQAKPQTIEDAKQLMKDIPGIKVELNKEVTIDFK